MEHSDIYKATSLILDLCNSFPYLPSEVVNSGGVQIGETEGRSTRMSIYVDNDANNNTVTLCSTLSKKFTVDIYYQIAAQNNEEKLNALDLLSNMANWLINSNGGILTTAKVVHDARLTRKSMNGLDVFETNLMVTIDFGRFTDESIR